jgi:hypothetical protein
MRFDPRNGFDAEVRAAIAATLPRGADANAVLEQLAQAARWHFENRNKPRSVRVERDQLLRDLKLIEHYAASLRAPRLVTDIGGTLARRLRVLDDWKRDDEQMIKCYDWILRRSKGHDQARELFYGEILRIWAEAGGRHSMSSTGGQLASFLAAVTFAVTGEWLKVPAMRKIVKRWRRPARIVIGILATR